MIGRGQKQGDEAQEERHGEADAPVGQ
jgi:hypothetical protein